MKGTKIHSGLLVLTLAVGMALSSVIAHAESDIPTPSDTISIGYGTMSKETVASAVANVKSEEFLDGNINDAALLIKGKVAGLDIAKGSGNPSESSTIMLRGVASLLGGSTPLILIDGVEGSLNTVSPENIAEITVLKDASAAAIYGLRGSNGVILITTKTGRRGQGLNVSYSGYGSFSNFAKNADFMDAEYIRGLGTDLGESTDWLGLISGTGWAQNHNVALQGGIKNTTYSANVSYRTHDGVIKGSFANDFRAQLDVSQYLFKDIVKININVLKSISKTDNQQSEYIYRQAVMRNPTAPAYTEDGDYFEQFSVFSYYNPLTFITGNEHFGQIKTDHTRLRGNLTLEPIKGWKTNLMYSWRTSSSVDEYRNTDKYPTNRLMGSEGSEDKTESSFEENMLEVTSGYENTFGRHHVSAFAGYSRINELTGIFGRISYGYDDRYNVTASLRRESSSRFGSNYKWANFPSVSASWNIHNEGFMENTKGWLSNMKLRAGWGMTGFIPEYEDLALNPDYHWETSSEINLGLDMGFFADRLTLSVDLYDKTTEGLLYGLSVPVIPNIYSSVYANVGVMNNKGIEVMITGTPVQTKDFKWTSSLAVSHNSNKLVSLSNDLYTTSDYINLGDTGSPINVTTHRLEVGTSMGNFWGLKSAGGVTEDGKWIVELPDGSWVPYSYGLNSDEYRQYLGNGIPSVNLSWGNTFSYKGFDLGVQINGKFGFDILNTQRMFYQNNSIVYNRLRCANDPLPVYDLSTKKATGESKPLANAQVQTFISEFIEKGDYLKLDNLTLGYTFDTKNVKFISNARIYITGENLICITRYSGIDPELGYSGYSSAGIDNQEKYPTVRTFSIGASITF